MPTCYRHSDRETYISCQRCGRPICPDCMRDAAVGFHCPHCVAEGKRTTRSGRTPYGGKLSSDPTITSKVLIGINLAVWLAIMATGGASSRLLDVLTLYPYGFCNGARVGVEEACTALGAQWVPGVADGAWWQLITNAFTHQAILHLGVNMLALWFLGPQLELAFGRARFLVVYFGSALSASALVYAVAQRGALGASGAIFGLLAALLVLAIKVRGNVQSILFWVVLNFAFTAAGNRVISWEGHLGGFLGGLAIAGVLIYAPRERRVLWQTLGVGAIGLVILASFVIRTLTL